MDSSVFSRPRPVSVNIGTLNMTFVTFSGQARQNLPSMGQRWKREMTLVTGT